MRFTTRKLQRGFLLIAVTIIVFTLAVLGMGLLELCRMEGVLVAKDVHYLNAFHLAEGGIDRALWKLKGDPTWTTGWEDQALNQGTYSVSVEAMEEANWYRIVSTGDSGDVSKTITLEVKTGSHPAAFDYALFWANPSGSAIPVALKNHVVIDGGVFAYGSLTVDNNSSISNGFVYATGTVSGTGNYVEGELPAELPERVVLDTTYYDSLIAQAAMEEAGDWTVSATEFLFGQTVLVNGNISIAGGTLRGPGTIVATGDITMGNNWEISDGVDSISGANIIMDNHGLYQGSGNVIFARNSIDIGNNITLTEKLSILTPGLLYIHNHITIHGLLYADDMRIYNHPSITGSMYANNFYSDEVRNHPLITYDASVLDVSLAPGLSSDTETVEFELGQWEEQ